MLQTHYPILDIRPIAKVRPMGLDGQEMKPDNFFDAVMEYTQMTPRDYKVGVISSSLSSEWRMML